MVDAQGRVVPTADPALSFFAEGAQILAVDNGDATDLTTFSVPARKAFGGKCLAILRASRAGEATVRVATPGLPAAEIRLQAR